MSHDDMSFEELLGLEARLRWAETSGEEESLGRVLRTVQARVTAGQVPAARRWSRRVSMFAVVGIPAAAAAAIGAILILNGNNIKTVRPVPATSPSPQASPVPSPAVSPSPAAPRESLLVITQRLSGDPGNVTLGQAPDTVLLARRDGTVVARASFKPAERPLFTNAATIFPAQVHAAAGAAYYIDGDGVVRRLDRDGTITTVATFATTEAQHMTAFAVSPDGSRVMASVFTFGARGPGLPGPITIGPSYDNLEYADAGGPTTVLSHTPLATSLGHFMIVGWDEGGPIAGTEVAIATQNVVPAGWLSPIYRIDLQGNTTGGRLAGDCVAAMEVPGGKFLCAGGPFAGTPTEVRSEAGAVLWTLPPEAGWWDSATLSPKADILALKPLVLAAVHNHLYFEGGKVTIPDDFYSVGWLDEGRLVGYSGDLNKRHLALIEVGSSPAHPANPVQLFPIDGSYAGVTGG